MKIQVCLHGVDLKDQKRKEEGGKERRKKEERGKGTKREWGKEEKEFGWIQGQVRILIR